MQKRLLLILVQFFIYNCASGAEKSFLEHTTGEFYSETYYDSRFDGAVTDSRFYNRFKFLEDKVQPYLGLRFTRDLSNNGAPLAIENAVMPTLGLSVNLLPYPYYLSLFAEKRFIYRTESLAGDWQSEEFRYGLIYYFKKYLFKKSFVETYGDWIQIDRVSERSVYTTWIKLGYRVGLFENLSVDPYAEGFTRQSGDPGYGPLENEWRLGARVNTDISGLYVGGIVHYSIMTNINPGQFDALLVLSMRFY